MGHTIKNGLAIDLGKVLKRKCELQPAADTIALFAARELAAMIVPAQSLGYSFGFMPG